MRFTDSRPVVRPLRATRRRFRCTLRCGKAMATLGDPVRMAAILTPATSQMLRRARLTVAMGDPT